MARRKRQLLDDDDSSSVSDVDDHNDPNHDANDPDAREERELFEDPYKRKRRRKDGKVDAIYGVFADDDEDEGFGGRRGGKTEKRRDWAKAPAFVSGEKVDMDKVTDADAEMKDAGADEEVGDGGPSSSDEEQADDAMQTDDSGPSKPPSPRVREEEEEEVRPRFGGIGIGASTSQAKSAFSGFKGGLGFSRGGIGSSERTSTPPADAAPEPSPVPTTSKDLPSAFGGARAQRSFLRDGKSRSGTPKPAPTLSAAERQHFSKLGSSFGAKMLEKMGWQAGTGLGASGEGIVTPVESKLRPKGMGLAFKGFGEKTAQAKAEARRRGEVVSDDEDKPATKLGRKAAKAREERAQAWKKPRKAKTRIEHKTYEEIVAGAGQDAQPAGVGQIIDATGATLREVSSLADVSMASWTPTSDPMRLPEVRHNLRLITEACKGDLDGLAKEAKALGERKKWIQAEDARLRKKVNEEAELISRLQQVNLVVDDINSQARDLASMYEPSLESFSANFEKLLGQYANEFDRYRLDEVIVAAIAPIVRRMLAQWHPLQDPVAFTSLFRLWRNALKMATHEEKPQDNVSVYGSSTVISPAPVVEKPMTPYESLLWNAWLPKVRSSINNEWSPDDPQPAVRLYEAWSAFLPPFIRDNFFDQLILPKVAKAVDGWNPRISKVPLQTLVFPWLPHVGLRLDDVLGDARRKVKSLLRHWAVAEGMPGDLTVWKDVFDVGDWDAMLLKYVVPKLGSRLREDFRVNPRNQDMGPLQDVMLWESLLSPMVLSRILETEFFPKWLDVLHVWLIQPNPSFDEVARWYSLWKGMFSENVQSMPGIAQGFTRGLQLMNKAIELGPNAPTQLPRPDHRPPSPTPMVTGQQKAPKMRPARTQEITFRSIVEDYASSHNLLFMPAGRVHEESRMPLFRVSPTADGKGGLLVYIQDDAVWAPDGDEYRAIPLENMVLRARK
ncbi:GC-rich sequence DNA-binding factor-like protein-domain-containing protein [Fomitopsis serialis]|uniref:GC-rich sequence DNA-binding factor-like protein-domain-containing protein n=1 Tax=Fomitopsis serialis TaxID=139415 RepID=UPI0020088546|nr:GC-rich sequence DNA-binding factor-like protein-domain-containing protein [Neoantrodia serialis]KAH9930300.1 GC-rich sequence DNA-binding factor-like protein-domain-containing protein [Neoantrodia serialis]